MDNKEFIKILKLTASLLELYGENQFKVRSYQTAVYNLERTNKELAKLDKQALEKLPGVGKSIAATIEEINQTGSSGTLENLLKQTPEGILDLLEVKGIGARKIKTAWDHLGIENARDLYSAATGGLLADLPGFGAKTQEKILQILDFGRKNKNLVHYKDAHQLGLRIEQMILEKFPGALLTRTGSFRRKAEVVERLQYLWALDSFSTGEDFLNGVEILEVDPYLTDPFRWRGQTLEPTMILDIRFCYPAEFGSKRVYFTGNQQHLMLKNQNGIALKSLLAQPYSKEEDVYAKFGSPLIIPELREGLYEQDYLGKDGQEAILRLENLKGILHNHSTYSDGKNSLSDMAMACKEMGYEYLGISDHSQTAVYANGLDPDRVKEQHQEIDRLNQEMAPFKIFKGIESDILNDGSLDYPEPVLQTFDFVVASIHFNINMDIKQATNRLIKAVENPYTTILGHPTGRQLLKREGYPIDHEKVIDACARNEVVIEINSHPWRLDLDWRWVRLAVEKGVLISINPDAHSTSGLEDVLYGVNVARKAGLQKSMTFNTLDAGEMGQYLENRKSKQQTISVD